MTYMREEISLTKAINSDVFPRCSFVLKDPSTSLSPLQNAGYCRRYAQTYQYSLKRKVMKGINSLAIVLLLLLPILASGSDIVISELYKKYGIEGALVIASLDGTVEYVHNTVRAKRRYLPASTFKIPNTLIALEEGAIKDDKEIIKWDGIDKGWPSWNKDQNLKTAFSISCIWCYQKFAKHIGDERYIQYLNDLNYGNKKTGKEVTNFWLEGELAISSMEQIVFLQEQKQDGLIV